MRTEVSYAGATVRWFASIWLLRPSLLWIIPRRAAGSFSHYNKQFSLKCNVR